MLVEEFKTKLGRDLFQNEIAWARWLADKAEHEQAKKDSDR